MSRKLLIKRVVFILKLRAIQHAALRFTVLHWNVIIGGGALYFQDSVRGDRWSEATFVTIVF